MSRRFTASDSRWFTNYTDPCLYETALMKSLGAKSDKEYKETLQQRGEELLANSFLTPKLQTVENLQVLKTKVASGQSSL